MPYVRVAKMKMPTPTLRMSPFVLGSPSTVVIVAKPIAMARKKAVKPMPIRMSLIMFTQANYKLKKIGIFCSN